MILIKNIEFLDKFYQISSLLTINALDFIDYFAVICLSQQEKARNNYNYCLILVEEQSGVKRWCRFPAKKTANQLRQLTPRNWRLAIKLLLCEARSKLWQQQNQTYFYRQKQQQTVKTFSLSFHLHFPSKRSSLFAQHNTTQ